MRTITTMDELKSCLENAQCVAIDFYAEWCAPCHEIWPVFEELSTRYPGISFFKVDVEDSEDLAIEYNISCMPTFLFFYEKKEMSRFSGINAEKLRKAVESLSNASTASIL